MFLLHGKHRSVKFDHRVKMISFGGNSFSYLIQPHIKFYITTFDTYKASNPKKLNNSNVKQAADK